MHALLHAGIINAGGFLLTRLAPLYALSPSTLHVVFTVGMLTALLGSSMMLVQSDIKKTLGYSTIGQMGFMIMECGLGAYGLSIFHLIAHSLFKGTIFLNCGYVIHAARQEPRLPPKDGAAESAEFSSLTWITGFATTLILPLMIVLAAHGVLNLPLRDSQGTAIFLFFGWATSSQAILTLYRLKAVASWKVAVSMLFTLFFVVVTYLLAAESFSHFLFPAPGEVIYHFRAGALPAVVFRSSGHGLCADHHWRLGADLCGEPRQDLCTPDWVEALQVRFYLLLINRLYLDAVSARLRAVFVPAIERANRSPIFIYGAGLLAVTTALFAAGAPRPALVQLSPFILLALALPLFPLHWILSAALTRCAGLFFRSRRPRHAGGRAVQLDVYASGNACGDSSAVSALALIGALYGSIQALRQIEVPRLLAYASLALLLDRLVDVRRHRQFLRADRSLCRGGGIAHRCPAARVAASPPALRRF